MVITTLAIGSLRVSPPLLLAPMAGITDLAVRQLAREKGAPFCFTEMISAEGLIRNGKNTLSLLRSTPEDRPLGIQLFGADPAVLAEGIKRVEERCDLIDINMGCPVKKVVSGGSGSALLRQPMKVEAILRAARKASTLPLTIKIRTGWRSSETTFLEIARIAEGEGCDAITLHPRSRMQMFADNADWDRIVELKNAVSIPVIGSGDIFTWVDALEMLGKTGCDGVMIARGALGNPWIFRQLSEAFSGNTPCPASPEERCSAVQRHIDLLLDSADEDTVVREMRKHLSWYVKGMPGAAGFRSRINTIGDMTQLQETVSVFFSQVLHECQ